MDADNGTSEDLIVRCASPLNAETEPRRLLQSFITPERHFFIRNHGVVPPLAPDHPVDVSGRVRERRQITADELKRLAPARTVTATIQCAGNRRSELQAVRPTAGNQWSIGAIGNAVWTGVSLRTVLEAVGAEDDPSLHVAFTGADEVDTRGIIGRYGASITMAKALERDVILAWAMNGEPLTAVHGAPLRVVVPGYAGVRSVKWLLAIEVRDTPSDAPTQAIDYKLFAPTVTVEEADWEAAEPINELPVNSTICDPADQSLLAAGRYRCRGYATAAGRGIDKVELSLDGGRSWRAATLIDGDERWSWVRWSIDLDLLPGSHELVVRAVDRSGRAQPASHGDIWNFAGYCCTAWHRVRIRVADG